MAKIDIFKLNERIQKTLNKLPVEELVTLTASELHEIWKKTTYIKDDKGNVVLDEKGNPKQVEKWKKLDPTESPEEKRYVDMILRDPRFLTLPYVRKNEDNSISIDIAKMKYSQLSPHWQKENKEAAEVAVELTLDNFVYLSDPDKRDEFRKISYIRQACIATVKGKGLPGYIEALHILKEHIESK